MSQLTANLEIKPFSSRYLNELKFVQLEQKDEQFASSVNEFLQSGSEHVHLFIIKFNLSIIGFFKLDTSYSQSHSFCTEKDIGLLTLAIDKRFQGRGLGAVTLNRIQDYLEKNYLDFQYLYLTVNHKNPVAISVYEKAGFEYTGEDFLLGPAGPQYIIRKKIKVSVHE